MKSFYDTCTDLALILERNAMATGIAAGVKAALVVAYKTEIDEEITRVIMHRAVIGVEDRAARAATRGELRAHLTREVRERIVLLTIHELQKQAKAILDAHTCEWALCDVMTPEQVAIVSRAWDTAPEHPGVVALRKVAAL